MSAAPTSFPFSTDLASDVAEHLSFLRAVHALGLSLRTPTREEFRRYVDLWLPLLAGLEDRASAKLVPPADVAWLWHCHRLAPTAYRRTCAKFGIADLPNCAFTLQAEHAALGEPAARQTTRELWAARHPAEPFFVGPPAFAVGPREYGRVGAFDVVASAERQRTFLWQVSGPRFLDPAFLEDGVLAYGRFLHLIKQHRVFAVPTYQIDLFWHTHMLRSGTAYQQDCQAIAGQVPDHDDSVNDRSHPGTKLNVSFKRTCELWQATFGRPYHVAGGMYRGEPPAGFFQPAWVLAAGVQQLGAAKSESGPQQRQPPQKEEEEEEEEEEDAFELPLEVFTGEGFDDWQHGEGVAGGAPAAEVTDGFVAPQPKSTSKGVNSNPAKEGYVWGRGAQGTGYYKLGTDEADAILKLRLRKLVSTKEADERCHASCVCCVGQKQLEQTRTELAMAEKSLDLLEQGGSSVELKLRTSAKEVVRGQPRGKTGKSKAAKPSKTDTSKAATEDSDPGDDWALAAGFLYIGAASCGAGSCGGGGRHGGDEADGGGCGAAGCGAACGAAACGAAACGGGGDGGGCGGGGGGGPSTQPEV